MRRDFSREDPAIPQLSQQNPNMSVEVLVQQPQPPPPQAEQSNQQTQAVGTVPPTQPLGRGDNNSFRNTQNGQSSRDPTPTQPFRNTRSNSQREYIQFYRQREQQNYGKRGRIQGEATGDSPPKKDSRNGDDRYRSRF